MGSWPKNLAVEIQEEFSGGVCLLWYILLERNQLKLLTNILVVMYHVLAALSTSRNKTKQTYIHT